MKRFMRWLRVYRTPTARTELAPTAAVPPESDADHDTDAVVKQVIERLSEDEALRRNLTDDAFKPIFDLVTSLVPAAAERLGTRGDEQLHQSARQLVQSLGAAVTSGDTSVVSADLLRRFMSEDQANETLRALASGTLPDAPGARAEALVGTVKAALSRGHV